MKANKDKQFENMLRNYANRQTAVFRFDSSRATGRTVGFRPVTAIAFAVLLLVCGVVFSVISIGKSGHSPESSGQNAFVISVSAQDGEDVIADKARHSIKSEPLVRISKFNTYIVRDDKYSSHSDTEQAGTETICQTCVGIDALTIKVRGEDVKSFDITSVNGTLDWMDFEGYETHKPEGKKGDYLHVGTHFEGLRPFDVSDPYTYVVGWLPSEELLNQDLREITGGVDRNTKNPDSEDISKLSQGYNELLTSAEELTKYFGDTVTITIYYKDNTVETVNIVITLDENGFGYVQMQDTQSVDVY